MAKITEIKFFKKNGELYIAFFGEPPAIWCTEFWLKNEKAIDYGITEADLLQRRLNLEQKYPSHSFNLNVADIANDSYEMQKTGGGILGLAAKAIFGAFFH